MDPLSLLSHASLPFIRLCRVPDDLDAVTAIGPETPAREAGVALGALDRVWGAARALYCAGVYPALQLCIRRHGMVVLNRALGHAVGNGPDDAEDADKVRVATDTPFCIYSASKAITAMLIHKLDERNLVHLEDRVVDYIPEFGRRGKHAITIRHLLAHRAGIPNLPPEAIDLDLLATPGRVIELLCQARPRTRPGRLVAYHAVTSGFLLAEIAERVTGQGIRKILEEEISGPLGLRWMQYGVALEDVGSVAHAAYTGFPVPPPLSQLFRNALGADLATVVDLSNDPRFLTGIIPSANVVTTAEELCAFYDCLLHGGELSGVRIFEPRTIQHATSEQSFWEFDLTLGLPLRYGLGLMLGNETVSLFGWDAPQAFGHLGFTNIFSWADPERRLSVALVTSGKPVLGPHMLRLVQLASALDAAFPKVARGRGIRGVAPLRDAGSDAPSPDRLNVVRALPRAR